MVYCVLNLYTKLSIYQLPYTVTIPLAGRDTTVVRLLSLVLRPSATTLMVYCVLHGRLDKVALVAVALSTVYIIREPPSGW